MRLANAANSLNSRINLEVVIEEFFRDFKCGSLGWDDFELTLAPSPDIFMGIDMDPADSSLGAESQS
jgi:hypothetical protein